MCTTHPRRFTIVAPWSKASSQCVSYVQELDNVPILAPFGARVTVMDLDKEGMEGGGLLAHTLDLICLYPISVQLV